MSGGLLYAITKSGADYKYNTDKALDIPKALTLITDVLWDLSVITKKNSALAEDVIDAAAKKNSSVL